MPKRKSSSYTLSSSSDEEPEVKLPGNQQNASTRTSKKDGKSSSSSITTNGSKTPEAIADSKKESTPMTKLFLDIEKSEIEIGMTRDQFFQFYNQTLILDYLNQDDRCVDLPVGLSHVFTYFSEVTGVVQANPSRINEILAEDKIAEPSTSTILPPPSTPTKNDKPKEATPISDEVIPKKRKSIKRNPASAKKPKTETPIRTPISKQKTPEQKPTLLDSDTELEEDQYIVEKLLDKKTIRKKVHYLVKWAGYPDSDNSWEPIDNVSEALVHDFEQNRRKKK